MTLTVRPSLPAVLPRRELVAAEIEASKTVSTRVVRSDSLLIIHHEACPVGEYWDICYGNDLTDAEILEFIDLENEVLARISARLRDIEVERQENDWPHPYFPDSPRHTYVRLCPKVVVA
ncbi:hypothetical protein [Kitasatospora sp. NPDC058218]|uniref:hypothetical protein n=1 Tax=Kitasatospora sp. NPDC058218 TaxID=3346385 RepID=UPI0036DABCF5